MGLFQAVLDAIFYQDDLIAGQRVTRLQTSIDEGETASMEVESTNGFGRWVDGGTVSRVLVNGEIIESQSRTVTKFLTLTRGVAGTVTPAMHLGGSLVYDASGNMSALDHVRRGILVEHAIGEDLNIIGANLGLRRCPGLDDDTWREIIQAVAYLPKQTLDAFSRALTALLGAGAFTVYERTSTSPYQVFVELVAVLSDELRGTFVLNGGERQVTTGLNTVETTYDINNVIGVYEDNILTRRGFRDGYTNYFLPGGTSLLNVITLGTSPGAAGTAVIVDYGAFTAHYLAPDETVRDDADFYAYLTTQLLCPSIVIAKCSPVAETTSLTTRSVLMTRRFAGSSPPEVVTWIPCASVM